MRPHLGVWRGTFVPRGLAFSLSITITLDEVNDDGTLSGEFQVSSDAKEWKGPNNGEIQNGSYSTFGTLHLEQENEAPGKDYHDRITFDGRFEIPDDATGIIFGTVLISRENSDSDTGDLQTGTLAAVFAGIPDPHKKFAPNIWDA